MSKADNKEESSSTELSWALMKRMIIPALIAIYLMLSLLAMGWLLLDVSTGQFQFFDWIGITLPEEEDYIGMLKLVCYTAIGGSVGAITYGMLNLQQHAASKNDFDPAYLGDYVFRPFGSAALAVVIFALLRGGLLTILGGDPANTSTSIVASFSAFGIGFLAGFGTKQVIDRLNELIKEAFSADEDKEREKGRRQKEGAKKED